MADRALSDEFYATYNLDHLGLVAGMAVKAMILNGLGYINRTLYLMPHFFKDKPVERLLGPGILASSSTTIR